VNATPSRGTADEILVALLDGATVRLRLLDSDDFDAVVSLADSLSDEERYLRFFAAHPAYVDEWASSLTEPYPGIVALGAFENGRLVGVGNYAEGTTSGSAEIAVVVAHLHHDRGVGTALLGELGRIARRNGIRHLTADVLAENSAIHRIIVESPWPFALRRHGTVYEVDVDLERPAAAE
jgi:GNAT superfamily N-acetyltransferase